eukprot:TRINITY_DN770_c3_g1_i9.p1 TRINITY_DN770_c3_g1~~TRINITY_DN770_c3_g1_i9.p1  ORF type:complete len:302 (+),score=68.66 TRINITY_DN770_c3_g1_i9:112-1017(+)
MNSVEMCCSRLVMSQFESPELRLSADFYLPGCDVQKRQRLIKKLFEQNDKAILDSISRRFTTVWSSKIVGQIVDQASAAIQSRRSVASLESTIGACHSSRDVIRRLARFFNASANEEGILSAIISRHCPFPNSLASQLCFILENATQIGYIHGVLMALGNLDIKNILKIFLRLINDSQDLQSLPSQFSCYSIQVFWQKLCRIIEKREANQTEPNTDENWLNAATTLSRQIQLGSTPNVSRDVRFKYEAVVAIVLFAIHLDIADDQVFGDWEIMKQHTDAVRSGRRRSSCQRKTEFSIVGSG